MKLMQSTLNKAGLLAEKVSDVIIYLCSCGGVIFWVCVEGYNDNKISAHRNHFLSIVFCSIQITPEL